MSAAILYAVFHCVTAALSTLVWVYPAEFAHLVAPAVTPDITRRVTYRAAVIQVVFALSIPVALAAPPLAWAIWFLAAPIRAVVIRRHPSGGSMGPGHRGRDRV